MHIAEDSAIVIVLKNTKGENNLWHLLNVLNAGDRFLIKHLPVFIAGIRCKKANRKKLYGMVKM